MPLLSAGFNSRYETLRRTVSRTGRPALFALALFAPLPLAAQIASVERVPAGTAPYTGVKVLTQRNDNQRTGRNLQETALTPANVKPIRSGGGLTVQVRPGVTKKQEFGKLFTRSVDGQVYGQPLYVPAVPIIDPRTGRVVQDPADPTKPLLKNVLYVTTANNTIYAFDADNAEGRDARPIWVRSFNYPIIEINPVPATDVNSSDITPVIGIIGTPVIRLSPGASPVARHDLDNSALYVVVRTKEVSDYKQRLYALDLSTGFSKFNGGRPTEIRGSVPGTGDDVDFLGQVQFNPLTQNQQAALTLVNDKIYIAWGGHDSKPPFHGWVMAYDALTLQPVADGIVNTTPNGTSDFDPSGIPAGGGITMSGAGLATDFSNPPNFYATTGVGIFNRTEDNPDGSEYGSSVLRIKTAGGMGIQDFFTPFNQLDLSETRTDFGTGGVLVLPSSGSATFPNMLVAAGTEGTLYLLNRDDLGGFNIGDNTQLALTGGQELTDAVGGAWGAPAFHLQTAGGLTRRSVFYHGTGDVLKEFRLFNTDADEPRLELAKQSSVRLEFPGASPVVSANGATNGIIWEVGGRKPAPVIPGAPTDGPIVQLVAYDAADISKVLYNNLAQGVSADAGKYVNFSVPTVANGKVYVGGDGTISAFGFTEPKPVQAARYLIKGSVYVPAAGFAPLITQNVGTYFEVTAIGLDGSPLAIGTPTEPVNLQAAVRQFGSLRFVGTVAFRGTSNVVIPITHRGSGEFIVKDALGNSASKLFFVRGTATEGLDHFLLRGNARIKNGQSMTVQAFSVSKASSPVPLVQYDTTGIPWPVWYDIMEVLPDGIQDVDPFSPGFAYANRGKVSFFFSSLDTIRFPVRGVGSHLFFIYGPTNPPLGAVPTENKIFPRDSPTPPTPARYVASGGLLVEVLP